MKYLLALLLIVSLAQPCYAFDRYTPMRAVARVVLYPTMFLIQVVGSIPAGLVICGGFTAMEVESQVEKIGNQL